MKVFQRYLETVNKGQKQIEYLPKAELDHLLCKFFPMSVKQMAMNTNRLHCQVSREVYNYT
jgi:hypothetical protein